MSLFLHRSAAALLAVLAAAPVCSAQDAAFYYIAPLGGRGQEVIHPAGVGPGPTVYGTNDYFRNTGNFRQAFVWTPSGGTDPLPGTSSSGTSSGVYAISPGASVIAGVLGIAPGSSGPGAQVFRRAAGAPDEFLPLQPGMFYPQVTGISDDTTTTIGVVDGYGGGGRAVVWSGAQSVLVLPALPDAPSAQALAVNADGSVITGWSGRGYPYDNTPTRWVNGQIESLGLPPGCAWAWPKAISADGSTIAGLGWVIGGATRAFVWHADTGYAILPSTTSFSGVASISADARYIGGYDGAESVIWRDGVRFSIQNQLLAPGTSVAPYATLAGGAILSRDARFATSAERYAEPGGDAEYHAWAITLPGWFTCTAPEITDQTNSITTCAAGNAELSLTASGSSPSYHWRVESPEGSGTFVDLAPGAFDESGTGLAFVAANTAGPTLSITGLRLGSHPNVIRFVGTVSNSCSPGVESLPIQVTVCAADFNCDSSTDFFDYLDFVQAFDAEAPSADFNADGTIDFFDYLDFAQTFAGPC